ncbi:MAG: hypothetical protein FD118_4280 [Rhodocyclaceae bacterium]|nr:MAG: hypothetical protein FD118_4280 [Rhodocyclaceae bacterium]
MDQPLVIVYTETLTTQLSDAETEIVTPNVMRFAITDRGARAGRRFDSLPDVQEVLRELSIPGSVVWAAQPLANRLAWLYQLAEGLEYAGALTVKRSADSPVDLAVGPDGRALLEVTRLSSAKTTNSLGVTMSGFVVIEINPSERGRFPRLCAEFEVHDEYHRFAQAVRDEPPILAVAEAARGLTELYRTLRNEHIIRTVFEMQSAGDSWHERGVPLLGQCPVTIRTGFFHLADQRNSTRGRHRAGGSLIFGAITIGHRTRRGRDSIAGACRDRAGRRRGDGRNDPD